MQEKTQIQISTIAREGLAKKADEDELIIYNELLANKSKIEDLIISYYFKKRGRVFNVSIEKPILNNELNGVFNVRFEVGHFNACADVDTSEYENMLIQFEYNPPNGKADLVGEFVPEREPGEI